MSAIATSRTLAETMSRISVTGARSARGRTAAGAARRPPASAGPEQEEEDAEREQQAEDDRHGLHHAAGAGCEAAREG
jgi:hypothetical protein